jgi:hypothetical protein
VKRYQWEWCTGRRLSWLRGGGTRWLWATWGEWLRGERMLFPVLPEPLAERLLRRAGRCVDDGCTGNAEKCAECCGRGGGR